jgi:hypothetical protein
MNIMHAKAMVISMNNTYLIIKEKNFHLKIKKKGKQTL